MKIWHVIPIEDLKEHEESPECWCNPTETEAVWVHNAADGREAYETGVRQLH